jgi:hypothetical protein
VIWGLNCAYEDTSDNFEDYLDLVQGSDVNVIVPISYADRSSKHIVTDNLGYQADKFSVDALIQRKSGFTSTDNILFIPGVFDPYVDVDSVWVGNLAAHYQLSDNIKLSVVGEGFLDKFRQETANASLTAQRWIWASVSVRF